MKTQQVPRNNPVVKKDNPADDDEEDDSDFDDSDFEDDFGNGDNDPAIEAFRRKRIAELKALQIKHVENIAKGHNEYRTITQDEFLPECINTTSEFVAVHFYHNLFERCKIMDMHIKKIVSKYTTCKFLRIDAEKCPFFVTKLQIKTLPTLIVFQDGKTINRLTGFEGLVDTNSKNKTLDEWPTRNLKAWLSTTGAIKYNISDGDSDDENDGYDSSDDYEERVSSTFGRLGVTASSSSRYNRYDDDV